jgi:hypothetical protein
MPLYHITERKNLASILEQGLLPHIGPRASDFGETIPAIYLFESREALEDAILGWLGNEFESEDLICLEVEDGPDVEPSVSGMEKICRARILPERVHLSEDITEILKIDPEDDSPDF